MVTTGAIAPRNGSNPLLGVGVAELDDVGLGKPIEVGLAEGDAVDVGDAEALAEGGVADALAVEVGEAGGGMIIGLGELVCADTTWKRKLKQPTARTLNIMKFFLIFSFVYDKSHYNWCNDITCHKCGLWIVGIGK